MKPLSFFISQNILIIILSLISFPLAAAPGDLDPRFGDNGLVLTEFHNCEHGASIQSIAFTPDHKIVAAGYCQNGATGEDVGLARYHADGRLDSSFNSTGKLVLDFSNPSAEHPNNERIVATVVQPDGKILVGGRQYEGENSTSYLLTRLNTDGSLDRNFGEGGRAQNPFRTVSGFQSLGLQRDGKIIAFGAIKFNPRHYSLFLVRFNPDGNIDRSFGLFGIVVPPNFYPGYQQQAKDLLVDRDGNILVLGTAVQPGDVKLVISRFSSDGVWDSAFGEDGIAVLPSSNANIGSFIRRQDGDILVARKEDVMQISPEGQIDSTFGNRGMAALNLDAQKHLWDIALTPRGKILVTGFSDKKVLVAQFRNDGSPDTEFNGSGWVQPEFAQTSYTGANKILVQRDGKIILGGFSDLAFDSDQSRFIFSLIRLEGEEPYQLPSRYREAVEPTPKRELQFFFRDPRDL